MAERSSGELWTEPEEERLRVAYLQLVEAMPGRSEAAVFARLERIRSHNRDWPGPENFVSVPTLRENDDGE